MCHPLCSKHGGLRISFRRNYRRGKSWPCIAVWELGGPALVAACLLSCEGIEPDEAFSIIGRVRGFSVPDTDEQKAWVKEFAAECGKWNQGR